MAGNLDGHKTEPADLGHQHCPGVCTGTGKAILFGVAQRPGVRDLAGKNPLSHAERVLRDRLRAMVADELALVLGKGSAQALDLLAEAERASLEKR